MHCNVNKDRVRRHLYFPPAATRTFCFCRTPSCTVGAICRCFSGCEDKESRENIPSWKIQVLNVCHAIQSPSLTASRRASSRPKTVELPEIAERTRSHQENT